MIFTFLKRELKAMLQFQKRVLLVILKVLGALIRYGLWLLPWVFFAVFLWRPALESWKFFTQDTPDSGTVRPMSFYTPNYGGSQAPGRLPVWETVQYKVDAGVRSFERISRQVWKK